MAGKKGNKLPKKGNLLHPEDGAEFSGSYEGLIASALRRQLGGNRHATKTLMRWTGASARTTKNWLAGAVGPSGMHLILLMTWSDAVFDVVIKLSRRNGSSDRIAEARSLLAKATFLLS